MSRKPYDPLSQIASPEVIRARLTETLELARRLQLLLNVSERLNLVPMPDERCETCRFWKPSDYPGEAGDCRRYPPQIHVTGSEKTHDLHERAYFPQTCLDDWCGEYQRTTGSGVAEENPILKEPISVLHLSVRATLLLERLATATEAEFFDDDAPREIVTVGDLTRTRIETLLSLRKFGATTLKEISAALARHNLRLRDRA